MTMNAPLALVAGEQTPPQDYQTFLRSKLAFAPLRGIDLADAAPNPHLKGHQQVAAHWALAAGSGLVAATFGLGKCHGAGTKILMFDGSIKNVEDVTVGDQLRGDDNTPRTVLSLARGRDAMYAVELKNGDRYTCNQAHIFSLRVSNKYQQHRKGDVVDLPLNDYLQLPHHAQNNCFKHYKVAVDFDSQAVPFDAYLYGTWLGDGHQRGLTWTINNADTAIVDRIYEFAQRKELSVQVVPGQGCKNYSVTRTVRGKAPHVDEFYFIQSSSDDKGKHIDPRYLRNDRDTRLQLLAGLLDTDGYLVDKCYELVTKWEGLRDDILFLARSLGFAVSHNPKRVNGEWYQRIFISGDTHQIPCLTRKAAGKREQIKNPLVYGFSVKYLGYGEYYGFTLDGNSRYLLGDFTVTHNTRIQCEIAGQLHRHTGQKFLVVSRLSVKPNFILKDGPVMGQTWEYVTNDDEALAADTPFLITNYERVRNGDFNPRNHELCGVSLDDPPGLRDMGSETFQVFNDVFSHLQARYVNTATPSPNDYIELLNYAEFLGVMDHGQALTRWFKRDSSKAGHLTLHPHHEQAFWMWVASWALFLFKPSDLGYSDEGYELPRLNVRWHRITTDQSRAWAQSDSYGQRRLFLNASNGVSEASVEKHATLSDRIAKMTEILAEHPQDHWLLWHHLEAERHAIEKVVPSAVSVYGSQELEDREQRIMDFTDGKIQILATKPKIAGSGCNFQQYCHRNIFVGVQYQFEEFIQALHRTYRFLQEHDVDVNIIYAESEDAVVDAMKKKWELHNALILKMREIVQKYGLSHELMKRDLTRSIGIERREVKGEFYTAVNNDSVIELANVADNSVGLVHTSIPFGNHYEYTTMVNDLGHNHTDAAFWEQMDFLIPHLFRVLQPGRIAAIHVKDRILYGHQTPHGFMEVSEFSDDCVKAFRRHGFLNMGRVTISTDVVRENSSTYRLGWSEMCKDGTKMGVGLPEYLLIFRKPPTSRENARADAPVTKHKSEYSRGRWQIDAHAHWRSNGNRFLMPEELADLAPDMASRIFASEQLQTLYDYERHVAITEAVDARGHLSASYMMFPPKTTVEETDWVWDAGDVVFMRSLNSEQSRKREQNHICPLPFDIVDRAIRRFSNEGDIVLDPFLGLGTVLYRAIQMKRRGIGIELNPIYFDAAARYLEDAEFQRRTPDLFTWLALQEEEAGLAETLTEATPA